MREWAGKGLVRMSRHDGAGGRMHVHLSEARSGARGIKFVRER